LTPFSVDELDAESTLGVLLLDALLEDRLETEVEWFKRADLGGVITISLLPILLLLVPEPDVDRERVLALRLALGLDRRSRDVETSSSSS
jgi:hypothetical protein